MQKFFLIWNSNNWNNRIAKLRQHWEGSWSRLQEIYGANFTVLRIVSFFSEFWLQLFCECSTYLCLARVVSSSQKTTPSPWKTRISDVRIYTKASRFQNVTMSWMRWFWNIPVFCITAAQEDLNNAFEMNQELAEVRIEKFLKSKLEFLK